MISVVKFLLFFLSIKNIISRISISKGAFVLVVAVLALGMGKGPAPRLGLADDDVIYVQFPGSFRLFSYYSYYGS